MQAGGEAREQLKKRYSFMPFGDIIISNTTRCREELPCAWAQAWQPMQSRTGDPDEMMKKIRLIAFDVDGTLLRSDKTLDPETAGDIQAAADAGIFVGFCSGRSEPELRPCFEMLPMMRFAVGCSGAWVFDRDSGRVIGRSLVPRETAEEILKAAEAKKAMLHFLTDSESIMLRRDVDHLEDFGMGVYRQGYMAVSTMVNDMAAVIREHEGFEKINIYFRSAEDREWGYDKLRHLPLEFAYAEAFSLEMTAPGVNKAYGLMKMMDYLGISREETAAVGDADNDRAMLEMSAFSVAMGNAAPEIKQICRHVTEDNDHNGAGRAVRLIMKMNSGEQRLPAQGVRCV